MRALEYGVQIAKKFKSRITLIYVYQHMYPVAVSPVMYGSLPYESSFPPELVPEFAKAARKDGTAVLAQGEKLAKSKGAQAELVLKNGHPVEEILKTAEQEKFDLIVMGARGLSTIKKIVLGSVSHGVTTHAPCPVLIVR